MPTIGWFEILMVVAVAIIAIGPKDFPFMLKKVGSWIGTAKRYISNVQNEVADLEINSDELGSAGLIDSSSIDNSIFGTGKFYKEKQEEKKENIYENIDEMLGSTLINEDEK